jgi:hypothetical protein
VDGGDQPPAFVELEAVGKTVDEGVVLGLLCETEGEIHRDLDVPARGDG